MASALFDRLRAHRAKLHRAVRVTAAAAVAYELATRLDLPQGFWAVITAVIVMQSSVGGTLAASVDRMVGTVGGAVVGATIAVVCSWSKMPEVLGLAAAIIPLSIAACVYQSMRVAQVTAAIMQLASPSNVDPVVSAADRVFEIALGSHRRSRRCDLRLPGGRARRPRRQGGADRGLARRGASQHARPLLRQPRRCGVHGAARAHPGEPGGGGDDRRRSRARAVERPHRRPRPGDAAAGDPPAATHRHPCRPGIDRAAAGAVVPHLLEPLHRVDDAMAEFLPTLSRSMQRHLPPPSLEAVNAAVDGYDEAIRLVWQQPHTRDMPLEAVGRVFALSFALEQLRENASDLRNRAAELTRVR